MNYKSVFIIFFFFKKKFFFTYKKFYIYNNIIFLLKKYKKKIFFIIQNKKNTNVFYLKNKKKKKKIIKKKNEKFKEIRLRIHIEINDYRIKIKKTNNFLMKGFHVKVVVLLKGRDILYKEKAVELLMKFQNSIKGIFFKFSDIELDGKNLYSIFIPKKK